jgi:hypothetical protein
MACVRQVGLTIDSGMICDAPQKVREVPTRGRIEGPDKSVTAI